MRKKEKGNKEASSFLQAPSTSSQAPKSPSQTPLKHFSSPLQALLQPPWSHSPILKLSLSPSSPFQAPQPSQKLLKPASSLSQAPFEPCSNPLQTFLKPPWSPPKPFWSPQQAASLEAPFKPLKASPFKPPWSPLEKGLKPPLKPPLQAPLQAFWRWRALFVLVFGSFLRGPPPDKEEPGKRRPAPQAQQSARQELGFLWWTLTIEQTAVVGSMNGNKSFGCLRTAT